MSIKDAREGAKRRVSTFYIVMTATLTALAFVATFLIQIPVGIGYVNFGDAVVMVSSVVLGPLGATVVGAIGPALADIVSGYVVYAPFTMIIKGCEGFVCALVFKCVFTKKSVYLRAVVSFVVGVVIVVVGYFLADFVLVLVGYMQVEGSLMIAALVAGAATLVGSLIQVAVSVAIALIVAPKLPTLEFLSSGKNR